MGLHAIQLLTALSLLFILHLQDDIADGKRQQSSAPENKERFGTGCPGERL